MFEGLLKGFFKRFRRKYRYSREGLEKQREYGRIGGLKSGQVRRQKAIDRAREIKKSENDISYDF